MRKVAFLTLGCKVNQSDSAGMQELFRQAGYEIVDFAGQADVYVINTCVVTNVAQNKSKKMIRRAARLNPEAIIAVCGCYAQLNPEEVKSLANIHLLVGTAERSRIVELVEKVKASGYVEAVKVLDRQTSFEEMLAGNIENRTRAYLKIQEGCNQFCSYCIIPYTRGFLRSRSVGSVRQETERLVRQGFKEIVLIGIHLGAYGSEFKPPVKLSAAVKAVLDVQGIERVRLGSLESIEVESELLELFQEDARLCRHLHLPLQAGSDQILQAMKRPYTAAQFLQLVEKIRLTIPDIAITTDIIVGFPGETEKHFQETLALVEQAKFSSVHVFPFSARHDTPAADMPGQLPSAVKNERVQRLTSLAKEAGQEFLQSMLGKTKVVLFEKKLNDFAMQGLTDNYLQVEAPLNEGLLGNCAPVKILSATGDTLKGQLSFK